VGGVDFGVFVFAIGLLTFFHIRGGKSIGGLGYGRRVPRQQIRTKRTEIGRGECYNAGDDRF